MHDWVACDVILDESRLHSRREGEVAKRFGVGGQSFLSLRAKTVNPCS
jgi:hypothetical protein